MSKQIKKLIPYLLILIVLVGVGVFGSMEKANASILNPGEPCIYDKSVPPKKINPPCQPSATGQNTVGPVVAPVNSNAVAGGEKQELTEFEKQIGFMKCGIMDGDIWPGCVVQITYGLFYQVSAFILGLSAEFFNVLITITLSSTLFAKSTFIPTGWAVVRDLSNLFFILILLYIAVKIILDLGGSEAKKMIAKVVVIALLINFSMFFTQVVIDTSNILALVFYNKLQVDTKNADGTTRPYGGGTDPAKTGIIGKDVSGAMVNAFNPTSSLTWEGFFKKARTKVDTNGIPVPNADLLPLKDTAGTMIALILVSGAVMLFAAYAFFVAGLSFLGRLIELWVLIIFSPFALMSSTIPLLGHVEYIGWDAWSKRLFAVSFMAPIFMFFMYLIFLLIKPPGLFGNLVTNNGTGMMGAIQTILLFTIPALVILILLHKATEYAKKGSGVLGEKLMTGAKMIGGLALGAVTGGAALAGRGLIGGVGGALANKAASLANKAGATDFGKRIGMNKLASGLTSVGALAQRSSFDVRAGGFLSKATGLRLGEAQKGGIEQARKNKVEKRMKRAEILKVRDDEKISKDIKGAEMDLQVLLNKVAGDFSRLDSELEHQRQIKADNANSPAGSAGAAAHDAAVIEIKRLNDIKTGLKDGTGPGAPKVERGANDGMTIKDLQSPSSGLIQKLKTKKEAEGRRRTVAFAKRTGERGGRANREAEYKIIMESKIESRGDH